MEITRAAEAQNARTSMLKYEQQPLTLQVCHIRLPARMKPVTSHLFNTVF